MFTNKEILYAYMGGLIDGEGSIKIIRTVKPNKPNEYNTFDAAIRIGMTDKEPIELFKEEFGGSLFVEKRQNYKDIYRWQCAGNKKVPPIVEKILPYLIVKKPQAELLLEYTKNRMSCLGFGNKDGVPIEEYKKREEIFMKMKLLNNRKSKTNE